MTDAYEVFQDAESRKAYDVWSGYLAASTGDDPHVREVLDSLLGSALEDTEDGEFTWARRQFAEMHDRAREGGLTWAPTPPRADEEDRQVRDYAKDLLPEILPLPLRDRLDHVGLPLRVLGRRFRDTPGLDTAIRDDVIHITARAEMALDLAHVNAAKRELERLKALARRCGVKD